MRPHPKHSRTNPRSPRAWATSDRSGFIGNQENMQWQYQWAGTQLINLNILVYPWEYDEPQRQLGTIILPPDPVAIRNARPEQYYVDEYASILFEVPNPGNLLPNTLAGPGYAGYQPGRKNREPATAGFSLEDGSGQIALEYGSYYSTSYLAPPSNPLQLETGLGGSVLTGYDGTSAVWNL